MVSSGLDFGTDMSIGADWGSDVGGGYINVSPYAVKQCGVAIGLAGVTGAVQHPTR